MSDFTVTPHAMERGIRYTVERDGIRKTIELMDGADQHWEVAGKTMKQIANDMIADAKDQIDRERFLRGLRGDPERLA